MFLFFSEKAFATLYGVDVSYAQGVINWSTLSAGSDFVVMRSSYGNAATDAQLSRNKSLARSYGVLHGFYHYAYPQYYSALSEANYFVGAVGDLQPDEILVLDYEETAGSDPVGWSKTFLDRVYFLTGVKPLLYMNYSMMSAHDWSSVINGGYGIWLAYWDGNSNPSTPSTQWPVNAMKQYSGSGSRGGLSPVDLDSFPGTEDEWGSTSSDGPTAVAWNTNRIDVFSRGTANHIGKKTWTGGTGWTNWYEMNDTALRAPAVVSRTNNQLDLFYVGAADNQIYHRTLTGSTWNSPTSLGGSTTTISLAACSWGTNRIDLFWVDSSHHINWKAYSGSWSSSVDLGVSTDNAPAACSWGNGRIDLFYVNPSNKQIYQKSYSGGSWSSAVSLGSSTTLLAPAACSRGNGMIDLFWVEPGNDLRWKTYSAGAWGSSVNITGSSAGNPAVCARPGGVLNLFYRGIDDHLYTKTYSNGTWNNWSNLGNYFW